MSVPIRSVKSEKLLYKVPEVSKLTGLGSSTIWRLIWKGILPACRLGGTVRVPPEAIKQIIKEHTSAAGFSNGK